MENKVKKRNCQNCKTEFEIVPEDFSFYEKIKVPPPTFCPECRTVRRLCWRNEMSLFHRRCDAPGHGETIISFLPPEEELIVYDSNYWWSDQWDPLASGRKYDFNKPFFTQWKELMNNIPLQCLSNIKATNSDYCNVAEGSKDSYLSSASWQIERTFYSNRIAETRDCSDLYVVHKSELCYDSMICRECYRLLYSINCKGCVDSYFLYDCIGCMNCFGCANLRNESYWMWNKPLSKGEYFEKLKQYNLTDCQVIEELKKKFRDLYSKAIHRYSTQVKSTNSTGDNLDGVRNCKFCFDATGRIEDAKYCHWLAESIKDAYDAGPGVGLADLVYEVFDTGIGNFRNLFTSVVYSSREVEYSFNCHGCDNLFGCLGLRTKKYCILNKQYTKEEYEKLLPKIKKQMMETPYVDQRGIEYRYGEFFPAELSTFCYNETQAQDYFPLTKEEALKKGYHWRNEAIHQHDITLEAKNLPDKLENISDSILEERIGCLNREKEEGHCRKAFRITEGELNLYKRLNVPLPKMCFHCRHEKRLALRNPMKLWRRKCMCRGSASPMNTRDHSHGNGCLNEFETPYASDRPEIIYCEKCYQKEVY